jgi:hypothetical protein
VFYIAVIVPEDDVAKHGIYVQGHHVSIAASEPVVGLPIVGDPSYDRIVDVRVAGSVAYANGVDDSLVDSQV